MTGLEAFVLYARKGEFVGVDCSDLLTLRCKALLEAVWQGVASMLTRCERSHQPDSEEKVGWLDLINKVNAFEVRAGDILWSLRHLDHSFVCHFATTA